MAATEWVGVIKDFHLDGAEFEQSLKLFQTPDGFLERHLEIARSTEAITTDDILRLSHPHDSRSDFADHQAIHGFPTRHVAM